MAYSLLNILGVLFFIGYGITLFKTSLYGVIALAILWVAALSYIQTRDLPQVFANLFYSVRKCIGIIQLFVLIGITIAAFIISGAVPTLIYYGLGFLSPHYFLPLGLLLCGATTLAMGSCWATIGTMGVTLIGLAALLNIHLPLAAGMIVSGAYFGDKISPASDTTILSALTTGTPLHKHIRGMIYTLIPAFILTFIVYYLLGIWQINQQELAMTDVNHLQELLRQTFHINLLTLAPLVLLLSLNLLRVKAAISMLCSIVVALTLAYLLQAMPLATILQSLIYGPPDFHSGNVILKNVFHHGGLLSISGSLSLTLLILMLGGLIERYGYIQNLLMPLIQRIKTPLQLVLSTLVLCVFTNIILGEAYLTIVLIGTMFRQKYRDLGLDSCTLSKALEEGAVFSTPLIPWTTSGIFVYCTLGISPYDYFSWSILNWIAPLMFLLFIAANFIGSSYFKALELRTPKEMTN